MVSVWWLSCSRSRLSGKWDRCALVPLGVPQQGGEGGSWISPHGSADASAWVGRAGQAQGYSLPANSVGGTGGKGELLGGYLGQGMSLAQWCQASISAWELQVTQPMSWWCFTCTGQGRSGQFFGMGTGLSRLPFPSGGQCPAGKQSTDPAARAGCVPGN